MSKQRRAYLKLEKTSVRSENKLPTTPIKEGFIHFRFDYFDSTHSHFDGSKADFNWIRNMMQRLKDLQQMRVKEFQTDTRFRKSQYVHRINWEEALLNSFGINNPSPDLDEDAWQFAISKGNGRVHGFFIGQYFYVVWIDPEHRLNKYWKPNP